MNKSIICCARQTLCAVQSGFVCLVRISWANRELHTAHCRLALADCLWRVQPANYRLQTVVYRLAARPHLLSAARLHRQQSAALKWANKYHSCQKSAAKRHAFSSRPMNRQQLALLQVSLAEKRKTFQLFHSSPTLSRQRLPPRASALRSALRRAAKAATNT